MKQVTVKDIGGDVIKDNDQYLLKDNKFGDKLILSSTFLRANQSTNGHEHKGQEEVYFFVDGQGQMEIDDNKFDVKAEMLFVLKMVNFTEYIILDIMAYTLYVYLMEAETTDVSNTRVQY